jgi:hypothetical protein
MASVPEEYLCPITLSLMTDPVIGSDGRTYERSAIQQWLRSNPHSPLTREPMSLTSLKTNYALKSAIERYTAQTKVNTGAPKKAPPTKKAAAPKKQIIPAVEASAPPSEDIYYAIQVYQEEMARNAASRPVPAPATVLAPAHNEAERRKKVLLSAFCLIVIIVFIVIFSKLASSD